MKSRNVKLITSSLILICHVFIGYTQGDVYTIERKRYLGLRFMYSWDSFTMPTSICNATSMDGGCGLFDAVLDTPHSCSCYCQGSRTTFAFKDNKWRCVDNSRVRDVQDCARASRFYSETINPSLGLRTFDIEDYLRYVHLTAIPYRGLAGWQTCEVNLNSSWYLGCTGTRVRSTQHLRIMKELFSFTTRPRYSLFFLQLNSQAANAEMLKGKIINLGIRCTDPNKAPYQGCLMFKLLGQQTCNVSATNLRTTPTQQPSAVTTISEIESASTTIANTSATTSSVQRARVLAISSTASSQPPTFDKSLVTPSRNASVSQGGPPGPNSGLERQRTDNDSRSSLGLTAGIPGAIASLAVIIIVIGSLYYRFRYSKRKFAVTHDAVSKERNTQDITKTISQINAAFRSDGENLYKELNFRTEELHETPHIYASTYSVPMRPVPNDSSDSDHVHAALNIEGGNNINGSAKTQESFYSALETPNTEIPLQNYGPSAMNQSVYHSVEKEYPASGPVGTPSDSANPMYNVIEDLRRKGVTCPRQHAFVNTDGPKDANCNQPVYNVLVDDDYEDVQASVAMTAVEPLYNTVEPEYCSVYIYGANWKS